MMVGSRNTQIDMIRAWRQTDPASTRPQLPLHELAQAFRYQETGAHFGKIVIDI